MYNYLPRTPDADLSKVPPWPILMSAVCVFPTIKIVREKNIINHDKICFLSFFYVITIE